MRRSDWWAVLALFASSRLVYGLFGLHFDTSTFPSYLQFIDAPLLKSRLLESLWYSHAQPPLLNLLAGTGIKAFGEHAPLFFAVVFHLLGICLALCVFGLTARLTRSRLAAYIATALLVLSPAFVLYENWFMYTFPAAVLATAAAAALLQYLDSKRTGHAVLFFALLAALLLLRSLFHLVWFLITFLLLLAAVPAGRSRRQVLVGALGPLAVVTFWYGKNFLYYGAFAASTMLGLSLNNITTLTMTRAELAPLVEQGRLSPLAVVSRYSETNDLFSYGDQTPWGIPVLDAAKKSTGDFNYDKRSMIEVNRLMTSDGLIVARTFPFNYVIGIALANRLFFSPSSMNEYFSDENRQAAAPLEKWLTPLLYGVPAKPKYMIQPNFGFDAKPSLEVDTSLPLIFAWLILLPAGYLIARRWFFKGDSGARNASIVLGFMLLTILYVYLTSTMLELGENYRYKFLIEPMFLVLAVTCVTLFLRAVETGTRLRRAKTK